MSAVVIRGRIFHVEDVMRQVRRHLYRANYYSASGAEELAKGFEAMAANKLACVVGSCREKKE